jgi:hypothetical protein
VPEPYCIEHKTGIVYHGSTVIGKVFRHARVAAGTGGQRRPFWTATPEQGFELGSGASLGTRFTSPRQAFHAMTDFHRSYPAQLIGLLTADPDRNVPSDYRRASAVWDCMREWRSTRKNRYGF